MPNIDIQPGVKLVASLPISFILYASNINNEIRHSRFEGKDIEVKMDNNTVESWIWFARDKLPRWHFWNGVFDLYYY
jgi:hypothetical protein